VVYVANSYGKELLFDAKKNASKYTEEGPMVVREEAFVSYYPKELELWDGVFLKILYTPGHSDDSVCLIVGDMLFTGDTLIKNIRTVTKLKTGSRDKLKETLSMLEKLKGMGLMVYPGHEEQFSFDSYNLDNSLGTVLLPIKSA
jgi:glyoxylase-like metal-dependent hydrolase (beta-lactamase superfamily II)